MPACLRPIFLSLFLVGLLTGAEVCAAATDAVPQTPQKKAGSANPYMEQANAKAKTLLGKMAPDEVQALVTIRDAYGIVRSVDIVRDDVDKAAKLCGEKNPDLKTEMETRHKAWVADIAPSLKQKRKELDAAIADPRFEDKNRQGVRDYIKLLDRAADHGNEKLDKRPVTDAQACRGLIASMDRTGPILLDLLKKISATGTDEDGNPLPAATDKKDADEKQEAPTK